MIIDDAIINYILAWGIGDGTSRALKLLTISALLLVELVIIAIVLS